MKKKLFTIALATMGMLSVILLFLVACEKKVVPDTPTGLSTSVNGTSVCVSWNSVSNADYYELYWAYNNSGPYELLESTDDTEVCVEIRLREGSDLYFKVQAVNNYGSSPYSACVHCYVSFTDDPTTLAAPTGVSATVSGSRIKISWNSVPNAEEYLVYWSEDNVNYEYCIGVTSNTYIFDYEDEAPYEENYYKVKARNGYGEGPFSFYAYCHYDSGGGGGGSTTLDAPTNVSAVVNGTGVRVSWSSVSNASYYQIYRASTRSRSYSLIGTSAYTYFMDDNPLSDNYYKVTSVGSDGSESEMSSYAYCYYSNGGGGGGSSITPNPPTNVSASVSGTRIRVSWGYVSDASSYRVYRSSSSYGTYTLLGSSSYSYYYDDAPLSDNYYKVTSVGSDGSESEMSSYTYCQYSGGGGGGSVPDAPTGVTATNTGSTMVPNVKIEWNSVTNATSYKVFRSSTASGTYSQIGSATSNLYLYDGSPMQGKNYYKVKAVNSAGESAYSSYAMYNYDTHATEPCPPSVTVTGSSSSLTVKWTAATGSGCGTPTGYKVYKRNPHTGGFELLKTVSSSTSSYKDSDVHPGINRYAVTATNSYGESGYNYGNSSSIPLSKPSSFTAVAAVVSGSNYIKFTWSKVTQATGYQFFLSSSANGTYYILDEVDDPNFTSHYTSYPVPSGTTVYVKMRAVFRADYAGDPVYSDLTTYKTVTF